MMGKTLQYVKDFDFSPSNFCVGGAVKKYAKGGAVHEDVAQDKKMIAKAVHKHEKVLHKGEPLTKLKKGGVVVEKATGERYPSREAMIKHEAKETPRMQREEVIQRRVAKGVPVAPAGPLLALKRGGQAKIGKVMGEFKEGKLHSGSKSGPEVTNRKQALAIAMSEARRAKR